MYAWLKVAAAVVTAITVLVGAGILVWNKFHPMQAEEDRFGKLVAGVTLSSFRSTLGDDKPEIRLPPSGLPAREIYLSQYAYVQAWVDKEESVAAFSVTARTKDFHPTFKYKSQVIVLGQTPIANAFTHLKGNGEMALGGTCGKAGYYYEAFQASWSRGQTLAVGIASVGEVTDESIWHSLCTEEGGGLGKAAQRLADCNIEDFDPKSYESFSCFADSPAGQQFRKDAIINVFAITEPDGELPEEESFPQARLAPHDEEVPDNG